MSTSLALMRPCHFRILSNQTALSNPVFTAEAWVKVDVNVSVRGTAVLIQNVGADGFSVYALVLMSTGNWRFYLTVVGYEETQEGSMDTPVPGFSVLTTPTATPGTWSHVPLTFDGDIQRIYVDCQLVHSSYLPSCPEPSVQTLMEKWSLRDHVTHGSEKAPVTVLFNSPWTSSSFMIWT
jgi:hypothetical protein